QPDAATGRNPGTCVFGPVAFPPECVFPLQRYAYRAGDAFTIISSQSEYQSRLIEDANGQCVEDPTLSPLVVQRFYRLEPPCVDIAGQPETETFPNPCSVTFNEPIFGKDPSVAANLRKSRGIRIRSLGVTLDVTDVGIPFSPIGT